MVLELKLRKIGNSVGVVFPKKLLAHLNVGEGDVLSTVGGPDQSIRLTPSKADIRRQMEIGEDIMRRYRNTLRELAK